MTTIAIIPESGDRSAKYRAICGQQQALGSTPGQALDNMEQQLKEAGLSQDSTTAIILHRTQSDRFFSQEQQEKLKSLMTQFHDSLMTGEPLPIQTKQELDRLAEIELEATIQRSQDIFQHLQREQNSTDRIS